MSLHWKPGQALFTGDHLAYSRRSEALSIMPYVNWYSGRQIFVYPQGQAKKRMQHDGAFKLFFSSAFHGLGDTGRGLDYLVGGP